MIVLGIDPGLDGALAILGTALRPVEVIDTPTLTVAGRKSRHRDYDVHRMADLLRPVVGVSGDCLVIIEAVHAMPGQGVRSMFTMGYGAGVWVGLLAGLGIPYQYVTPQRWKRALMDGMGHDKDASRVVAMRLFPSVAAQLGRKKDNGRAEALLIAEYGRRLNPTFVGRPALPAEARGQEGR